MRNFVVYFEVAHRESIILHHQKVWWIWKMQCLPFEKLHYIVFIKLVVFFHFFLIILYVCIYIYDGLYKNMQQHLICPGAYQTLWITLHQRSQSLMWSSILSWCLSLPFLLQPLNLSLPSLLLLHLTSLDPEPNAQVCVCIWLYILQNYNYKLHFQNLSTYHIPHVSIGTLAAENLDVCTACDPW
jgi:hypothetical protein